MENNLSILQNITSLIKLREVALENREYHNALVIRNELKKFSVDICNSNKYWVSSKDGSRILWDDYIKMSLIVKTTAEKSFNQFIQTTPKTVSHKSFYDSFYDRIQVAEFAF